MESGHIQDVKIVDLLVQVDSVIIQYKYFTKVCNELVSELYL